MYHTHTLQTNTRHRAEELQNIYSNNTSENHLRQSKQLSPPRQEDCKSKKDIKKCIKQRPTQNPTINGRNTNKNQQQQNSGHRTDNSLSYRDGLEVRGGLMHFTGAKSSPLILWTILIILTFKK